MVGLSKAHAIPKVKMALSNSPELLTQPTDFIFCSKSANLALSPLTLLSRLFLMVSISVSRLPCALATSFWSLARTVMIRSAFSTETSRDWTCSLMALLQILRSFSGLVCNFPYLSNLFLKPRVLTVFSASRSVLSARREMSWIMLLRSK